MARKTFISYNFSEARHLRDQILIALGEDARYYQGETSDSPNLADRRTETIKKVLRDMLYDTSVTIVVISPKMTQSRGIDWEIEYSLKAVSRDGRTSGTNGIVGVLMKYDGGYDWVLSHYRAKDGCRYRVIDESKLYKIICQNRFNLKEPSYRCSTCRTVDVLEGSYISLIEQDAFLADPSRFIENAYQKSQQVDRYKIAKIIE